MSLWGCDIRALAMVIKHEDHNSFPKALSYKKRRSTSLLIALCTLTLSAVGNEAHLSRRRSCESPSRFHHSPGNLNWRTFIFHELVTKVNKV